MTPFEAAAQAIREARERFEYIAEPAGRDHWQPGRRFAGARHGDCFPLAQRIICRDIRTGLYALPTLGELREAYPDYEALSYDFEARKWAFQPILAWHAKGVRPAVDVRLGNGSRFQVTPDHRVWVYWGNKNQRGHGCAKRIIEQPLAAIDLTHWYARKLVVAAQIPSLTACYDSRLAYLDGIYAAEGYKNGKSAVCIAQDKSAIRAKIERELESLGISYRPSRRMVHASYLLHASEWSRHFRAHGTNSFDKSLPMEALSSYPEVVSRLIEGHRDGDAYVPKPGSQWMGRCEAIHATSSDELKRRLVLAFLILGKTFNRYLQTNHQGVGRRPIWRLNVWGDQATYLRRIPDYEGLGFNAVRSIMTAGEAEVCDITVAGTHNFVLDDGVLVHNCDDFAGWAIERAHELCPGEYRFVTGVVTQSRWQGDTRLVRRVGHAWCAVIVAGVEHWFDPTPGWPANVSPATEWSDRVAEECWRYAGDGQFVDHQLNTRT